MNHRYLRLPAAFALGLLTTNLTQTTRAQDIRGVETIELISQKSNWYACGKEDSCWDSSQQSYSGEGPFDGVFAEATTPCLPQEACTNCDWAGIGGFASASWGHVEAWADGDDVTSPFAEAVVAFDVVAPSGTALTIHAWNGASCYTTDGTWYEGEGTYTIPAGTRLIVRARANDAGELVSMHFGLLTVAPDEPAPTVAYASASAERYAEYFVPSGGDDQVGLAFAPSDLQCSDEVRAESKFGPAFGFAAYRQSVPAEGSAAPWTAEIELGASSTAVGPCDSERLAISRARLALTSSVLLPSATLNGGSLEVNGQVVLATDFPRILPAGMHELRLTSTSGAACTARISIRTSDDARALDDCDSDGVMDGCEILRELEQDSDANWMPDDCQRGFGDLTLDGTINAGDLAMLLDAWSNGSSWGDVNGDGLVNGADLSILLANWGPLP